MCNTTIPSVNLLTAVIMQIQEFANSGTSFSRYDITLALRQKVNDDKLELTDVAPTPGGRFRYDIRKAQVDAAFEQLWNNGLCDGIPALQSSYDPTKGYRLFSAVASSAPSASAIPTPQMVAPSPVVSTPTTPAPMPPPTPYSPPTIKLPTPPRTVNVCSLSDTEIRRRVDTYMKHCQTIGVSPSLKQIQSAIKRGNKSTGLSYREIANVAMSLGYKV